MTAGQSRIPATIGGYHVETLIGSGGQSEVFAVAATDHRPSLALKLSRESYTPSWTDPLAAEYRTLSALFHPQLVVPYDFGYDRDRAFMVIQRVDGPPLFAGLNRRRRASLWALITAVCPVLSFLHHRGIIHRDLKPANFRWSAAKGGLTTAAGFERLYLLDLGLVSRPRDPAVDGRAGTLYYMAPEVLKEGRVDSRSDLYSLGVILFEWLTGTPPFTGPDAADIINGHLAAQVRWPSSLPVDVNEQTLRVVERLLAKDPDRRPQDVEEVIVLFADAGLSVGTSFPLEQNIPWHRKTTHRMYPQVEFPMEISALAERETCVFLSGDPGSGASALLSRWRQELQIYGWSIKTEKSTLRAKSPGPAGGCVVIHLSDDPTKKDTVGDPAGTCCQLALRPLDTDLVAEYLQGVLFDTSCVQEVLPMAVRLSSGLPEAVDTVLAEWIASGVVSFRGGSWVVDNARLKQAATSAKLRNLYAKTVGELSANQCRCLGYAAVFGPHFSTRLLRRLLAADKLPPRVIDELFDRGLFIPFTDPDEAMIDGRFRLVGLADVWAADLPPEHRLLLHQRIASILDQWSDRWGKTVHRRLAHHFQASGQYQQATEAAISWAEYNATAEGAEEAHHYLDLAESAAAHLEFGGELDELTARIAYWRGRVYKVSGAFEQAQKNFRRVLAWTRKSGNLRLQAEAAKNLGDTYKSTRQHAKGWRILKSALRDFRRLGDEAEISHTLNNLGNIASIRGQIDVALEYYQKALAIQRKLDLKAEMASTLSNIGSVYVQKYDFERAQTYMRDSLRLKELLNQPAEVARSLNNLGVVNVITGQFDQAADYLARAAEINRSIEAFDEWLLSCCNLLETWTWQAKYRDVITEAPALLRQSEALDEYVYRAQIYVHLARAFHEIADYRSSHECLERAKSLVEKAADPSLSVRYFILLSERRLLLGDREGGERALKSALEWAKKSGDPRERGEVHLAAAKAEKNLGEICPEFFAAGEEAHRLFEKSAGRHRMFELLLATDDQRLSILLAEFPLPDDFATSSTIEYAGPPAQEGLWLWRLAQKAIAGQKTELALRLLSALVTWSEEHGVAELYWRASTEQGLLYHRAHDWEMAAGSFTAAVRQLEAIAETIESTVERKAYLSRDDVKSLNRQVAAFSNRFAEK